MLHTSDFVKEKQEIVCNYLRCSNFNIVIHFAEMIAYPLNYHHAIFPPV